MKRVMAWMLVAGLSALFVGGCAKKTEEPVVAAPTGKPLPPPYPPDQIPEPEAPPTVATTPPPPVDTTATATANPDAKAQPLPKESYPPVRTKEPRTYVVKSGDNLFKISRQFYGTDQKWRAIYEANRSVLPKGPNQLPEGVKLTIP